MAMAHSRAWAAGALSVIADGGSVAEDDGFGAVEQHPLIEGTLPIKWNPLLDLPLIPINVVTAIATCIFLVGLFLWVANQSKTHDAK